MINFNFNSNYPNFHFKMADNKILKYIPSMDVQDAQNW